MELGVVQRYGRRHDSGRALQERGRRRGDGEEPVIGLQVLRGRLVGWNPDGQPLEHRDVCRADEGRPQAAYRGHQRQHARACLYGLELAGLLWPAGGLARRRPRIHGESRRRLAEGPARRGLLGRQLLERLAADDATRRGLSDEEQCR